MGNVVNGRQSCKDCNHMASSESNLKVHIMTVHMKARFMCNICGKVSRFPSEVRTHVKTFHVGEKTSAISCNCRRCDVTFLDYDKFMEHAVTSHRMAAGV